MTMTGARATITVYGVTVYGLTGCETKRFKGADFTFVDSENKAKRRQLIKRLGSPTNSVILEDTEHIQMIQGVSVAALNHPYEAHKRCREGG